MMTFAEGLASCRYSCEVTRSAPADDCYLQTAHLKSMQKGVYELVQLVKC